MQEQNTQFSERVKTSITAKMLVIAVLSLVLLIPLFFIENLIYERAERQTTIVNQINKQWGNKVAIYGPLISVPYKTYSEKIITDSKTKKVATETIEHLNYAYFFPNELDINAKINPSEKKRGIYKTAVYNSEIFLKGNFKSFSFDKLDIDKKNIIWEKAKIIFKTSNVKGVDNILTAHLNQTSLELSSSIIKSKNKYYTLESKPFDLKNILKNKQLLTFNLNFATKGSEAIQFIPIGKETHANISSNWQTASFNGEFLPYNSDKISAKGFNAKWKILDINRPFGQTFFNDIPNLDQFNFGVNFKIPVDEYQKSERSAKYGFLVIALTFLTFFIIQIISKINIHPFQYLMIGFALLMFYTLLVSISEHSNFFKAYTISSIAVISLIILYTKTIFNSLKFALFVGGSLTILYLFIFIIIQLESYALLVGSLGLFLILTLIMFITRKINWFSV